MLVLIASAPRFGDPAVFDDNLEKLFSSLLLRNLYPDQAQLTEYQSTFNTLVDLLERLSPERRYPFGNWIVNAFRQSVSTDWGPDLLIRLVSKPDVLQADQKREIGNILASGIHPQTNSGSEKVVQSLGASGTLGLFASSSLAESLARRIAFVPDRSWVLEAYVQAKAAASQQTRDFVQHFFRDNAVQYNTLAYAASIELLRKLEPADLGNLRAEALGQAMKSLLEIIRGSEELQRWLPLLAQMLDQKSAGFQELGQRLSGKIAALSPKAIYELFHSVDHLTFTKLKSSPQISPLFEKMSSEP